MHSQFVPMSILNSKDCQADSVDRRSCGPFDPLRGARHLAVRRGGRLQEATTASGKVPNIVRAVLALAMVAGTLALAFAAPQDWPVLVPLDLSCLAVIGGITWREERLLRRHIASKEAQGTEALGRREQQFSALVQKSSDVIVITNVDGVCSYVSPALLHVFGHEPDALLMGNFFDLINAEDRTRVRGLLEMSRRRPSESLTAEWHIRNADGSTRLVEVLLRNLLEEPSVQGLVINLRDITERKELEEQLSHQALHDHLTGLGNRAQLRLQTEHSLGRWLFENVPFCMLVVDVNDFKTVNDSLGHVIGDKVLKELAERIQGVTRRGDTVVRVDGDEFAVLIEGVASEDPEATYIADRISKALQNPMRIEGRRIALRASIGLACVTERVAQADDIMRNADLALNAAKQTRATGVVRFEESMHEAAMRRVELETDLRRALDRDELQLFYQPTINIETGMFEGVEALIRWPHPQKGMIPPVDFIPVAEESGLIIPLGKWVLEQACLQMAKWQMRFPVATPLKMNVNLSARQFDDPSIVEVVRNTIEASGIAAGSLVLEVTESVLMENSMVTRDKMEQLVALGCELAIDDFGTGYSSLSYLQQYPIGVLKIDRSFVNEIGAQTGQDPALVRAILDIARSLQLRTVAEGIETRDQLEQLLHLGCDVGQGFFLAKPAPPHEVQRLLEATHGKGMPLPEAIPSRQHD